MLKLQQPYMPSLQKGSCMTSFMTVPTAEQTDCVPV